MEGSVQVVRYGRIGTEGHELAKTFEGPVAASKATQKLIAQKLGKGYKEVSQQEASAAHQEASAAHEAARSSDQAENISGGESLPGLDEVKPTKRQSPQVMRPVVKRAVAKARQVKEDSAPMQQLLLFFGAEALLFDAEAMVTGEEPVSVLDEGGTGQRGASEQREASEQAETSEAEELVLAPAIAVAPAPPVESALPAVPLALNSPLILDPPPVLALEF